MNKQILLVSMAAVFMVLFFACGRGESSIVGQVPPEIKAGSWLNTKPVTLASLKGKVVVVEFWATWCPPCRQTIPHLIEINNKYKNKGFVIISLTNEDLKTVEPFVKANKMTYPVGVGSSSARDYGVSGIPHAVIVGKDGRVAWEGHPMSGLDKELEKLLK